MAVDAKVPALDGFQLAATIFAGIPEWVIINSAMGVERSFYTPLAEFFYKQGFSVITYDYRGIGGSRPETFRGFDGRMRDWGMKDMTGILNFVWSRAARRIYMVGHGAGGFLPGLMNSPKLDAMAAISAYSSYWGDQPGDYKYLAGFNIYCNIPITSRLLGFVPWKAADGKICKLPRGVAEDWGTWCRHPDFIRGDRSVPSSRYDGFKAPVLAHSVSDDPLATLDSVDAVMSYFPRLQRRHLDPHRFDLQRLGPAGYFKPESATLWPELLAWFRNPTPNRKSS